MGSVRPPDPSPAPDLQTEVPFAVAEAIDSLARHRAAVARYASTLRSTDQLRARIESDRTGRRMLADARAERALERTDDSLARETARREREAEAAARIALRTAVERYARDLRRQGVPPERMIVAVKGVVRRAAIAPEPLPEPECLIPDLVQWSVAAYFAAD